MLAGFDSISCKQLAMHRQIEFLRECVTSWKNAAVQKENDQQTLIQLILTAGYLKEGLDVLFGREDEYVRSKFGPLAANELKLKHQSIMNTVENIYKILVDLSGKVELINKDHISDIVDGFCQAIDTIGNDTSCCS
jgi:hypothetical protein